jgi:hypothetical protein
LEVTATKGKPGEFVIQWQGGSKETYICEHRNYLISSLLRLVEIGKKVKPNKLRAAQACRNGDVRYRSVKLMYLLDI